MENKIEHFYGFWNWVDLIGLCGTMFIVICAIHTNDRFVSNEFLRVLASITSLCTFVKIFDWLSTVKNDKVL